MVDGFPLVEVRAEHREGMTDRNSPIVIKQSFLYRNKGRVFKIRRMVSLIRLDTKGDFIVGQGREESKEGDVVDYYLHMGQTLYKGRRISQT